jgi:hypothetical protein
VLQLDVSNFNSVHSAFQSTIHKFGAVDTQEMPLSDTPIAVKDVKEWDRVIRFK